MSDPSVFTQLADDQLGRLALIEAIRANTDAVQRLARHGEGQDHKLDEITKSLAKIDTRLALLENNSLKSEVAQQRKDIEEQDGRLRTLEAEREQRKGAMGLFDWIAKNWPAIIGFVALVVLLVSKGGWL